jgi:hypothetical protein
LPQARLTPEDIMNFLQEVTGRFAFIEDRTLGGFEITTDVGSSFSFEIVADTPQEAVLAYFWHVHQSFAREDTGWERLRKQFSLGRKNTNKLDAVRREKFAKLDQFARAHNLRPPPPKEEAANR